MRYTIKRTFRLDEETYKELVRLQKSNGRKNLSETLRFIVYSKPANTLEMRIALAELQREVNRIGNNINQIAKVMNAGYMTGEEKELYRHMEHIEKTMDDIYRLCELGYKRK